MILTLDRASQVDVIPSRWIEWTLDVNVKVGIETHVDPLPHCGRDVDNSLD